MSLHVCNCKVCNMQLPIEKRRIPSDPEWYPKCEKWHIQYREELDIYEMIVDYDCGYAQTAVKDIHYCPICGRELK